MVRLEESLYVNEYCNVVVENLSPHYLRDWNIEDELHFSPVVRKLFNSFVYARKV